MSATTSSVTVDNPESFALPDEVEAPRAGSWLLRPVEVVK